MSIEINNLHKSYSELTIYDDFSLQLKDRKISCILGPSGCGKTTLLNIIGGITEPDKGEMDYEKGSVFSYIFQEPRLMPWKTVRENIRFVLKNIKLENKEEYIRRNLKMVGLEGFMDYYPHQLSGGMKQRVSIARAFIYPSNIILMDEPLKTLDPKLKWNLMKTFLKVWQRDKRTVVFVTHDVDEALILGEYIYIFSTPPVQVIQGFSNPLTSDQKQIDNMDFFNQKKKILDFLEV